MTSVTLSCPSEEARLRVHPVGSSNLLRFIKGFTQLRDKWLSSDADSRSSRHSIFVEEWDNHLSTAWKLHGANLGRGESLARHLLACLVGTIPTMLTVDISSTDVEKSWRTFSTTLDEFAKHDTLKGDLRESMLSLSVVMDLLSTAFVCTLGRVVLPSPTTGQSCLLTHLTLQHMRQCLVKVACMVSNLHQSIPSDDRKDKSIGRLIGCYYKSLFQIISSLMITMKQITTPNTSIEEVRDNSFQIGKMIWIFGCDLFLRCWEMETIVLQYGWSYVPMLIKKLGSLFTSAVAKNWNSEESSVKNQHFFLCPSLCDFKSGLDVLTQSLLSVGNCWQRVTSESKAATESLETSISLILLLVAKISSAKLSLKSDPHGKIERKTSQKEDDEKEICHWLLITLPHVWMLLAERYPVEFQQRQATVWEKHSRIYTLWWHTLLYCRGDSKDMIVEDSFIQQSFALLRQIPWLWHLISSQVSTDLGMKLAFVKLECGKDECFSEIAFDSLGKRLQAVYAEIHLLGDMDEKEKSMIRDLCEMSVYERWRVLHELQMSDTVCKDITRDRIWWEEVLCGLRIACQDQQKSRVRRQMTFHWLVRALILQFRFQQGNRADIESGANRDDEFGEHQEMLMTIIGVFRRATESLKLPASLATYLVNTRPMTSTPSDISDANHWVLFLSLWREDVILIVTALSSYGLYGALSTLCTTIINLDVPMPFQLEVAETVATVEVQVKIQTIVFNLPSYSSLRSLSWKHYPSTFLSNSIFLQSIQKTIQFVESCRDGLSLLMQQVSINSNQNGVQRMTKNVLTTEKIWTSWESLQNSLGNSRRTEELILGIRNWLGLLVAKHLWFVNGAVSLSYRCLHITLRRVRRCLFSSQRGAMPASFEENSTSSVSVQTMNHRTWSPMHSVIYVEIVLSLAMLNESAGRTRRAMEYLAEATAITTSLTLPPLEALLGVESVRLYARLGSNQLSGVLKTTLSTLLKMLEYRQQPIVTEDRSLQSADSRKRETGEDLIHLLAISIHHMCGEYNLIGTNSSCDTLPILLDSLAKSISTILPYPESDSLNFHYLSFSWARISGLHKQLPIQSLALYSAPICGVDMAWKVQQFLVDQSLSLTARLTLFQDIHRMSLDAEVNSTVLQEVVDGKGPWGGGLSVDTIRRLRRQMCFYLLNTPGTNNPSTTTPAEVSMLSDCSNPHTWLAWVLGASSCGVSMETSGQGGRDSDFYLSLSVTSLISATLSGDMDSLKVVSDALCVLLEGLQQHVGSGTTGTAFLTFNSERTHLIVGSVRLLSSNCGQCAESNPRIGVLSVPVGTTIDRLLREDWQSAMNANNISLHGTSSPANSTESLSMNVSLSDDEKREWWRRRDEVESAIANAIRSLDDILGPIVGELLSLYPNEQENVSWLSRQSDKSPQTSSVCGSDEDTEKLVSSMEDEGTSFSSESPCAIDDLESLRLLDLRALLRKHGLPGAGQRAELIQRLRQHYATTASTKDDSTYTSHLQKDSCASTPKGHLVLLLDETFHHVPIESIPTLLQQSCSRLPSLHLLLQLAFRQFGKHATCSTQITAREYLSLLQPFSIASIMSGLTFRPTDRGWCVIDPENNLPRTAATVGPWISNLAQNWKWNMSTGNMPSINERKELFSSTDVFIYCGHGAGEILQLFSSSSTPLDAAVTPYKDSGMTLLWGCSSGKLHTHGVHDPTGPAFSHLMAGATAVVGNLWDVTDRDLDLLSLSCMEKLFTRATLSTEQGRSRRTPEFEFSINVISHELLTSATSRLSISLPSSETIGEALLTARQTCKLRFAVGSAAVLYGLPLSIVSGV